MAHKEIRHLKDLSQQQVHQGEILIKYLAESSAQYNYKYIYAAHSRVSYCITVSHYCLIALILMIERSRNEGIYQASLKLYSFQIGYDRRASACWSCISRGHLYARPERLIYRVSL